MKTMLNFKTAVTMLVTVLVSAPCFAQGPPASTPEHELLKKDVGVWDAACKFWMIPGQEPVVTQGVETNTMLGGTWLISEFKTDFDGTPFLGHSQSGYDPVKKKFVGTWVDNMNAHMAVQEGTYDKETKTFTFVSRVTDAITTKVRISKMVVKHVDDDHRHFESFDKADGDQGDWIKTMEIKYTRKKDVEKKSEK
jgi:hypothetical protein